MSHTFDWTWQFEIIQVTSENVLAKFIRISHDLDEQVASGQFALLGSDQEPGCTTKWPADTHSFARATMSFQCVLYHITSYFS